MSKLLQSLRDDETIRRNLDLYSAASNTTADSICGFNPLLLMWEQDKLKAGDKQTLSTMLAAQGYKEYSYFHGMGFKGRPQDMFAVLYHPKNPLQETTTSSTSSSRFFEFCRGVADRAGIYLYGNALSRATGLSYDKLEWND